MAHQTHSPLVTTFGWIGIACASALFLSPIPTLRRIVKERSVLEFSQLPYLSQWLESSFWLCWALSVGDRVEVLICNAIAVTLAFGYTVVFTVFTTSERRVRMGLELAVSTVCVAAAVSVLACKSTIGDDVAATILSTTAVSLAVAKYTAPLSVAREVVRTRSNEFMPLPLTLGCLAAGVSWGIYGLLLLDWWVAGPNLAGAVLGFGQISLWLWAFLYKRKHKKHEAEATAASTHAKEADAGSLSESALSIAITDIANADKTHAELELTAASTAYGCSR